VTVVPESVIRAAAAGAAGRCRPLRSVSGSAWLVESLGGERVVVRPASSTEVLAAQAADEAGVGPRVLDVVDGWLLLSWLAGPLVTTVELGRPPVLDAVAGLLRRWHGCGLELTPAPMQLARAEYVRGLELPEKVAVLVEAADAVELSLSGGRLVPAHLDVAANLVDTGDGLRLIDFEYAAAAPPERELGQLVWEAELGQAETEHLVSAYHRRDAEPSERASVAAWTWLTGVTWTIWAARHPELATYRRRSWERLRQHWALPGDLRR
jgi:thiamine kinase